MSERRKAIKPQEVLENLQEQSVGSPIPDVSTNITIIEQQTIRGYGHVSKTDQGSIYFDEMMRIMEAKGLGFRDLLREGMIVAVQSDAGEYLRLLVKGDEITLNTQTFELPQRILFLMNSVRDNKLTGSHAVVVDVNNEKGRAMDIPEWVSERLRIDIVQPMLTANGNNTLLCNVEHELS